MAGIYVHVPFCKQACHYCNFHFSTTLKLKDLLIESILREIELRKRELDGDIVATIYFGGGTPSILSRAELSKLLSALRKNFLIAQDVEITLEVNPDDVTTQSVGDWMELGFNRLSLGIQSFFDRDLIPMNRAHSAAEAHRAMEVLLDAQFARISMDLIYGSQSTTDDMWQTNLDQAADYNVGHLSCYALTVEPNTVLAHKIAAGHVDDVDDGCAARQFALLQQFADARGYHHYEISNLSLPGQQSVHNSSYWSQKPYLGLGPAAHSYNVATRSWNVAHNHQYIKAIQDGTLPSTTEHLSEQDRFNEFIMTSLRTEQGIDEDDLNHFGGGFLDHFHRESQQLLELGDLLLIDGKYKLAAKSRFRADGLASQLFII